MMHRNAQTLGDAIREFFEDNAELRGKILEIRVMRAWGEILGPFEEVYEVEKYGTYYSENKFWQKVQRVAKKVGATVIRPVFQLYYLLHDKDVPLQHKAYIIGALGYFILPFDLIPEGLLPVIGFTDDVAVMGLVLKIVKDSITPEIRAKADAKVMELLQTDKI